MLEKRLIVGVNDSARPSQNQYESRADREFTPTIRLIYFHVCIFMQYFLPGAILNIYIKIP